MSFLHALTPRGTSQSAAFQIRTSVFLACGRNHGGNPRGYREDTNPKSCVWEAAASAHQSWASVNIQGWSQSVKSLTVTIKKKEKKKKETHNCSTEDWSDDRRWRDGREGRKEEKQKVRQSCFTFSQQGNMKQTSATMRDGERTTEVPRWDPSLQNQQNWASPLKKRQQRARCSQRVWKKKNCFNLRLICKQQHWSSLQTFYMLKCGGWFAVRDKKKPISHQKFKSKAKNNNYEHLSLIN